MPRLTSRQRHRGNILAQSPEDYYRKNLAVPFLDHVLVELKSILSGMSLSYIVCISIHLVHWSYIRTNIYQTIAGRMIFFPSMAFCILIILITCLILEQLYQTIAGRLVFFFSIMQHCIVYLVIILPEHIIIFIITF